MRLREPDVQSFPVHMKGQFCCRGLLLRVMGLPMTIVIPSDVYVFIHVQEGEVMPLAVLCTRHGACVCRFFVCESLQLCSLHAYHVLLAPM